MKPFFHKHPYKPFIPEGATKLIVGTLPPPRFTTGALLKNDVNFCYGSYYNSLWKFIDAIYKLNLRYDNSQEAVDARKYFLQTKKIGICDIVESAERDKIDASDLGMKNIALRDIVNYLTLHTTVEKLLFIGGNSKNGPEYFFRKHLKNYGLKLQLVADEVPRVHQFEMPNNSKQNQKRIIKTVSLTSSSGSANRAIGSMDLYKQLKAKNPKFTTFDFRVMQYRNHI